MRFLLSIIICLISKLAFSQDSLYKHLPQQNGKVIYERVIKVDGSAKETLFTRIKDWADTFYRKQRKVLQSEDKETGYLAFDGYLPITLLYHGGMFEGKQFNVHLFHTLNFNVKDNEIKLVFTDLAIIAIDGPVSSDYIWKTKVENLDKGFDKMSDKRRERLTGSIEKHARRINRLVTEFLIDTQEKLSSK